MTSPQKTSYVPKVPQAGKAPRSHLRFSDLSAFYRLLPNVYCSVFSVAAHGFIPPITHPVSQTDIQPHNWMKMPSSPGRVPLRILLYWLQDLEGLIFQPQNSESTLGANSCTSEGWGLDHYLVSCPERPSSHVPYSWWTLYMFFGVENLNIDYVVLILSLILDYIDPLFMPLAIPTCDIPDSFLTELWTYIFVTILIIHVVVYLACFITLL